MLARLMALWGWSANNSAAPHNGHTALQFEKKEQTRTSILELC
jgi:hypothetical protein